MQAEELFSLSVCRQGISFTYRKYRDRSVFPITSGFCSFTGSVQLWREDAAEANERLGQGQ